MIIYYILSIHISYLFRFKYESQFSILWVHRNDIEHVKNYIIRSLDNDLKGANILLINIIEN